MTLEQDLGPLAGLVGTWEGDDGLDVAYSHSRDAIIETPYRERTSFSAFGPVENSRQALYGLDYRTAAWRADEVNPFHTEVGYWLWDHAAGEVMRCFVIPRGSVILAGGPAAPDAAEFVMRAAVGSETYGVLSNQYLAEAARCIRYEVTVSVCDAEYRYRSTTSIEHLRSAELLEHTDENSMHPVQCA
jgi:hypothetical protein